jgi:hypothetical protein
VSLKRLRLGELLALAGAICTIVSLFVASYENASGRLDAWDTFGAGVVLLILAAAGGLAVALTALTERSTALPVAAEVWCVPLALAGIVAAIVRLLERPDGATMVCAGAWLALAGTLAILAGAWEAMRDERTSLYPPASPKPRPRP